LCGWEDMEVPDSIYFILEIIKEMAVRIKDEERNVSHNLIIDFLLIC